MKNLEQLNDLNNKSDFDRNETLLDCFWSLKKNHFCNSSILTKMFNDNKVHDSYQLNIHTSKTTNGIIKLDEIERNISESINYDLNKISINDDNIEDAVLTYIIVHQQNNEAEKTVIKTQLQTILSILENHNINVLYDENDNFIDFAKNLSTRVGVSKLNGFISEYSYLESLKITQMDSFDYLQLRSKNNDNDHCLVRDIQENFDIDSYDFLSIQEKLQEFQNLYTSPEQHKSVNIMEDKSSKNFFQFNVDQSQFSFSDYIQFHDAIDFNPNNNQLSIPKILEPVYSFKLSTSEHKVSISMTKKSREQITDLISVHNFESKNLVSQLTKALTIEATKTNKIIR